MKRNDNDETVTKGFLREQDFATKDWIKEQDFATKDWIKEQDFATKAYIDLQVEILKKNFEESNRKLLSEFQTSIDPILKLVLKKDQEEVIQAEQIRRLKDKTDNHEKRIKKLEQS